MSRRKLAWGVLVLAFVALALVIRGAWIETPSRGRGGADRTIARAAAGGGGAATDGDAVAATATTGRIMVLGGEVRDQDDDPVEGALVTFGERRARTDERGRFAFRDVPRDGAYRDLVATLPSHRPGSRKVLCNVEHDTVTLFVERATPVHGRVLDLEGRPVEGARVQIAKPPERPWRKQTTGPDGAFRFDDTTDGLWTVELAHDDVEYVAPRKVRPGDSPVDVRVARLPLPSAEVRIRVPPEAERCRATFSCESDIFPPRRRAFTGEGTIRLRPGRWRADVEGWFGTEENPRRGMTWLDVPGGPATVDVSVPLREGATIEARPGPDPPPDRVPIEITLHPGVHGVRDRLASTPLFRFTDVRGEDSVLVKARALFLCGRAMVPVRPGGIATVEIPIERGGRLVLKTGIAATRRGRFTTRRPGGAWDPEEPVTGHGVAVPLPEGAHEWRIRTRALGGPLVTQAGTVTIVAGEELVVDVGK